MKKFKWCLILLVVAIAWQFINLHIFEGISGNHIYNRLGIVGAVLIPYFVLLGLGSLAVLIFKGKSSFDLNKGAKFGLYIFLILLVSLPLVMMIVMYLPY